MIKILIAEDMQTNYRLLKSCLEEQPDFEVVGWAKNGKEAVSLVNSLKPDVVTMDVQMPEMDGLEATETIMSNTPLPIIIVSALANNNVNDDLTFSALRQGAMAVCPKPAGPMEPDYQRLNQELIRTIRNMAGVNLFRPPTPRSVKRRPQNTQPPARSGPEKDNPVNLVAIGCSAGGPQALLTILKQLPSAFPLPIVITQHMTAGFTEGLVLWLDREIEIRARLASNNEILLPGTVYFAADNCQLKVAARGKQYISRLVDENDEGGFKPSVNALFSSVAKVCGKRAVGGLLSGMGRDGASGLLDMKNAGARTFVQDEASSLVYGMPSAALALSAVGEVIPLQRIAGFLKSLPVASAEQIPC